MKFVEHLRKLLQFHHQNNLVHNFVKFLLDFQLKIIIEQYVLLFLMSRLVENFVFDAGQNLVKILFVKDLWCASLLNIWWCSHCSAFGGVPHYWIFGCVLHCWAFDSVAYCWVFDGVPHNWRFGYVFHGCAFGGVLQCQAFGGVPHGCVFDGVPHCWAFGCVPHCWKPECGLPNDWHEFNYLETFSLFRETPIIASNNCSLSSSRLPAI